MTIHVKTKVDISIIIIKRKLKRDDRASGGSQNEAGARENEH
jgi:hypothetical protein